MTQKPSKAEEDAVLETLRDMNRPIGGYAAGDEITDEQLDLQEPPRPTFWTVALYLVDRHYGGPEEGGWWYDAGQRVDTHYYGAADVAFPTIHASEQSAAEACRRANEMYEEGLNRGRRPISSVLSEGRFLFMVRDGYPPARWPECKPRYE